jgi:choline kinase
MTKHCVILAAGVGSRISEHTQYIPKSLIPVRGRPIIETIFESLSACNITDVVVVVGYKADLLKSAILEKCSRPDLTIRFVENQDYYQTNTMYSLYLAREYLTEGFLFLHADLIFPTAMLDDFLSNSQPNAILVDQNIPHDWDDAMKVITAGDRLSYMSKSITRHEADGTAVGVYRFDEYGSASLFSSIGELLADGIIGSWVSEPINLIAKNTPIYSYKTDQFEWCDVDNTHDLERSYSIPLTV